MRTYQDYMLSSEKSEFIIAAVEDYRHSSFFRQGLDATRYFRGQNTAVGEKTVLRSMKKETVDAEGRRRVTSGTREVIGNRISSGFLYLFVTQQNQFLLSEGVVLDDGDAKKRLGVDFDHTLTRMGEMALLHGVCYGFWDGSQMVAIDSVRDAESGFLPILDEMTSRIEMGIEFWRIDRDKPRYIRLYTREGILLMRQEGAQLVSLCPREKYKGGMSCLPIFPLYANAEHTSEFTPAIKSKIDAYDRIISDFADNLDRANDVYWVLNNFGGTADEVAEMLEEINKVKAVVNISDGTGVSSTAEPHTIQVPYEARRTALELLKKSLYQDWMALDTEEVTGGSLTNVAIRVSCANMNLKADRYEWELYSFIRQILDATGITSRIIRFPRQSIANESEIVADIERMRPDIDQATALRLNPYLQDEEADTIQAKVQGDG